MKNEDLKTVVVYDYRQEFGTGKMPNLKSGEEEEDKDFASLSLTQHP